MNLIKWLNKNTHSLKGKTVAVTGSTGGLGSELCLFLAGLEANLVLIDRNKQKSENLIKRLKKINGEISVKKVEADFEDAFSVKRAADELKKINIDIFIINAAAYSIKRKKSALGLENVFQINFVSPYYIVKELLAVNAKIKVVAVSSIALKYSVTSRDDIDFKNKNASSLIYGNSKRFLTFSLMRLFKDSDRLSIVHPGICFTNITAHYPKFIFAIIKYPMKIIFMSPKKAALSILRGVFETTNQNEWIGPRLFNIWGLPNKKRLCCCKGDEIDFICSASDMLYEKMKDL